VTRSIGVAALLCAILAGAAALFALHGADRADRAATAPAGPTGSPTSGAEPTGGGAEAAGAGAGAAGDVLRHPRITWSEQARQALGSDGADPRLLALLVALAAEHEISVAELPKLAGGPPAAPRRAMAIDTIDGSPVSSYGALNQLTDWLNAQQPPYRPENVRLSWTATPVLVVALPPVSASPSPP
jgi:hypothetical protein